MIGKFVTSYLCSYKLLETEWDKKRYMHSLKCTDPLRTTDTENFIEEGLSHGYRSFLRENRVRDPENWHVSITSDDEHVFVAFFRRDR